jgi:ribonuclease BN (tRNA processing enzyme)
MKRAGYDPARLDAILLSHLHGDHYGGLPFLLLEYIYMTPRTKPLQVAGPATTEARVRNLMQLMYPSGSGPRDLPPTVFRSLQPGKEETIEEFQVLPFRVPHQIQEVSLGFKISGKGKKLLYSGDSAWTELFVRYSEGVDLFLLECSFCDGNSTSHMTYEKLQENLTRLGCKKLILTHMGPDMLSHRSQISLLTAEDGMVLEV